MNLLLLRTTFTDISTIGELYIDGVLECYCLEDVDRGLDSSELSDELLAKKIPAQTAIPTGEYEVVIDDSVRFKKKMPHILAVPAFTGIRIHSGNDSDDTEGCVLLGSFAGIDFVGHSKTAFDKFFVKLEAALLEGKVQVTVKRGKHDTYWTA